jgi:eukaryotic translation initiation factor 2C
LKQLEPFVKGGEVTAKVKEMSISKGKGKQGKGRGKAPAPAPAPAEDEPSGHSDEGKRVIETPDGMLVDIYIPRGDQQRKIPVFLSRADWNPDDKLQQSQMLQVAIKYSFYEKYADIIFRGRNMFKPSDVTDIGGGILLFSGIFQSVRINAVRSPILNVDLSYMLALNSNISVYDWLVRYASHNRFQDLRSALSNERFRAHLNYLLNNVLVQANYGSQAQYRLEGLADPDKNSTTITFANKKGEEISVEKYMNETYKMKSQFGLMLEAKMAPMKPSVEEEALGKPGSSSKASSSKSSKRATYLLAEFMKLSPGQHRKGETTNDERNAMIDHTRKTPDNKMREINKIVADIISNLNNINIDLGITVKNTVIECSVFKHKPIEYKQEQVMPENGGWNTKKLYSTPNVQMKWGIVYHSKLYQDLLKDFAAKFIDLAKQVSMFLAPPSMLSIDGSLKSIQAAISNYKAVSFFVCVLDPSADRNIYHMLKEGSYVHTGIPTQCVLDEKTRRGKEWIKLMDTAVVRNLIASVNAKLIGDYCNYIVAEKAMQEILAPVKNDDLLVIGADVYHGETQDKTKPSIAAMCASRDKHFNKYYTTVRLQAPSKELLVGDGKDNMTSMVEEILRETKRTPRNLLFYRDGVGEGMYDQVADQELKQLRAKVTEIYAMKKQEPPKITFVIVQKRNHLRAVDEQSFDRNPPPGTYVDDVTVIDDGADNFYMYSHLALAGTARPTHYQIQLNEIGFVKRQLAEFTFALAHLHQGCTKSVSLPACVYYADLACYIAGTSFRDKADQIKPIIKNTAFFV